MEEKELEERLERQADAILYFIDHPEAPLDPVLRAYVNRIKRMVEEEERKSAGMQALLAKG